MDILVDELEKLAAKIDPYRVKNNVRGRTAFTSFFDLDYIDEDMGIYFIGLKGEVFYIGKSANLKKRLTSHYFGFKNGKFHPKGMYRANSHHFEDLNIAFTCIYDELILDFLEVYFIKTLRPYFNTDHRRNNGSRNS